MMMVRYFITDDDGKVFHYWWWCRVKSQGHAVLMVMNRISKKNFYLTNSILVLTAVKCVSYLQKLLLQRSYLQINRKKSGSSRWMPQQSGSPGVAVLASPPPSSTLSIAPRLSLGKMKGFTNLEWPQLTLCWKMTSSSLLLLTCTTLHCIMVMPTLRQGITLQHWQPLLLVKYNFCGMW